MLRKCLKTSHLRLTTIIQVAVIYRLSILPTQKRPSCFAGHFTYSYIYFPTRMMPAVAFQVACSLQPRVADLSDSPWSRFARQSHHHASIGQEATRDSCFRTLSNAESTCRRPQPRLGTSCRFSGKPLHLRKSSGLHVEDLQPGCTLPSRLSLPCHQ